MEWEFVDDSYAIWSQSFPLEETHTEGWWDVDTPFAALPPPESMSLPDDLLPLSLASSDFASFPSLNYSSDDSHSHAEITEASPRKPRRRSLCQRLHNHQCALCGLSYVYVFLFLFSVPAPPL